MANKTALILAAFSLFPAFAESQVTVGRNVQQEIRASSEAGTSTASLSVTQVKTVLSDGKIVDGSIIGFFDPSSRLFWWIHQSSLGASDPESVLKEFLDSDAFSVQPDQIAWFRADGRVLWVLTSEMRVSSMEEGVSRVIRLLPEALPKLMSGDTLKFQRIPLAEAVGQTFLEPKDFGDPAIRLKVGAIERSDVGWRIEIRNDRGESKTVLLSKDLKTVTRQVARSSTRRVASVSVTRSQK